jgi:hypothetical protein
MSDVADIIADCYNVAALLGELDYSAARVNRPSLPRLWPMA